MDHDTSLIATIAVSLIVAFAGGYLASLLRMPPLVGYLLAGIAVGPFTPGFVADSRLANQLAEIGVILLMFGVGLHFSIRDLWAVRAIAVPGAVAQIAVATAIGFGLAWAWGWPVGAGVVFGLALSVASTVVLLRALEERHILDTINGRIAVGWLIVEDLATVVALVLLPALTIHIAPTGDAWSGLASSLGVTLAKVAAFVAIALVIGKRVVPWLLEQVAGRGSRELFTLAVLALALGAAYGSATLFGVSFALGAFFAGVIMSESDLSHRATADSLPLKDAFAVLFFVSVGMLFDPAILLRAPTALVSVLLVIIVGKFVAAFVIVLAFRYPLSTALTVSASLAQIGEFSFILAGLGTALGLLPQEGRDLILAGALLSIALNPLLFAAVGPMERWLKGRPTLLRLIERPGDKLSQFPPSAATRLLNHTIVVGLGRVGETVTTALEKHAGNYVIIEQDRQVVNDARKRGLPVMYGDASLPGVLEKAGVANARLLVVAIPEGFLVRQMVELAQKANPRLDIVVRTHSDAEKAYLERKGVGMAVMGERELALGMMGYALRSLGMGDDKARIVVQGFRTAEPALGGDHAETRALRSGGTEGGMLVLVATDLSMRSYRAIVQGAQWAVKHDAELLVLHVVDEEQPEEILAAETVAARQYLLRQLEHPLFEHVPRKQVLVRAGMDFRTILDVAEEVAADLLVLGEQRRRFFGGVFTGTTIERVVRGSRRPVLVIHSESAHPYETVVAAVDLAEDAAQVIAKAALAAGEHQLSVVHAHDDEARHRLMLTCVTPDAIDEHDEEVRRQVATELGRLMGMAGLSASRADLVIAFGEVVPTLRQTLDRLRPDLVVIGTRAATTHPLQRWLLGSVAEAIIADLGWDVLVVPLSTPGADA